MATCVVRAGEPPDAGYLVNTYVSSASMCQHSSRAEDREEMGEEAVFCGN